MDDPIADGMNAAGNLLNAEPIRNLLAPVTKEVGLVLGSIGSLVRFYCEDNLQKVFTKWARQRNGRPLEPAEFTRAIPLLQAASMVSDDELQERWAALLESSVTTPEDVLPSFGQTLSQLTADEARYLDRLRTDARGLSLGTLKHLEEIYDPELRQLFFTDRHNFESKCDHVHLVIRDLERLALITAEQSVEEVDVYLRSLGDVQHLLEKLAKQKLKSIYCFSEYGVKFIKAASPKPPAK